MEELIKLLSLPSVSGSEEKYFNNIKEIFSGYCDEFSSDFLGNIYGIKRNKNAAKKIIIDAHLDIIGLMVSKINDDGLIRFTTVGGVDTRILPSMDVVIHGRKNVRGVIGVPPPHLVTDGEEEPYKSEVLTIDTGLDKSELSELIDIGDFISFASEPVFLANNRIAANGLDNKLGVYCALNALKNSDSYDTEVTVALTVGEEINLNGARVAAGFDDFDLCIVIDVTHGMTPDSKDDICFELGSGPSVAVGPGLSKKHTDLLMKCADENNVRYTVEVTNGHTGTNSVAYEVSGKGIPCIVVSLPLRYMHTSYETADLKDAYELIRLISAFINYKEGDSENA